MPDKKMSRATSEAVRVWCVPRATLAEGIVVVTHVISASSKDAMQL